MFNNYEINTLLCVEDDIFYTYLFKDAAESVDLALKVKILNSSDEAEKHFIQSKKKNEVPDCIFVDLNLEGSSFNGLELIRKINFEHGNSVVIGIISSSNDEDEKKLAMKYGAQFWILKDTLDLEKTLIEFKHDFMDYKKRLTPFKTYK